MTPLSDQAVVLRLTEYSETSQIVTLFSASAGLLRLIAKGSRRSTKTRFAAGLDLLERGEVSYVPARGDAQLGTLTEWKQRDAYTGLRREAARLYGAMYAVELVAALTEESDPHEELYAALVESLAALAGEAAVGWSVVGFQLALLRAVGLVPELERCVECNRPLAHGGTGAYFSSKAGGVLCRDCEVHHVEKRRLPAGWSAERPGERDVYEWFALLDYHITYQAGRRLKTAEALERLLMRSR